MVSEFHNGIHDPKGHEKIYAIEKDREALNRRHTSHPHSPAVVKSNIFFEAKNIPKNRKYRMYK